MFQVALEPEALPNVATSAADHASWEGDLLVVAVSEGDFSGEGDDRKPGSDALKALDQATNGAVSDIDGFEGKQGQVSKAIRVGSGAGGVKARYVALVGLGKQDKVAVNSEWGSSVFQTLGSHVAVLAKAHKFRRAALGFLQPLPGSVDARIVLEKVATGGLLGGYETTRFKSKKKDLTKLEVLEVLLPSLQPADVEAAVRKAKGVTQGTLLTKYLVEAPPNVCTPTHIADAAAHIARSAPDVFTLEVLEKEQCRALGMGSFLGVAEASDEPPKFIHLTYTPKGGAKRKVAVVGKGLTFDSGGYNLKVGASMIELMKFDMGGAAATLGAAHITGSVRPEGVEIHFIVASCENMIAGHGLRPGDILKAASGKTIEVNNTDAEGRLTLADALWFAQEKAGVQAVVDVATLTGACMVALGPEIAGLFTPSDDMAAAVTAAAKSAGEKVWRMPMESNYMKQLDSPIADLKNTGSRLGGAITAALFLKEFINEKVEWAHLDIAGPVWDEKSGTPTGFGALTLAEWAAAQGKHSS